MAETWYCIESPQYGLLPFTAHTHRRGAIDHFMRHGITHPVSDAEIMKEWRSNRREGFRTVKITVRRASTTRDGRGL